MRVKKARCWLVSGLWLLLLAMPSHAHFVSPLTETSDLPAAGDTGQVWRALRLTRQLLRSDTLRAGRSARQALRISQAIDFDEGRGVAYARLGQMQAFRGETVAALRCYALAEPLLKAAYQQNANLRTLRELATLTNSIGIELRTSGDIEGGIKAYLRAVDYASAARDYNLLIRVYDNLGGSFFDLDQVEKGLDYLRQSVGLRDKVEKPALLINTYMSLGRRLSELQRLPEAKGYLEQARRLIETQTDEDFTDRYYRSLGIYYFESGQYKPARESFARSLAAVLQQGHPQHAVDMYQALGITDGKLGDYARASGSFRRGLVIARELGNRPQEAMLLKSLAELEEKQGQLSAALSYYKRFQDVTDSLGADQTKAAVLQMETKYRTRQQEQQIRTLQTQRRAQQAELRRQTTLRYATQLVLVVLVGAVLLGYVAFRSRQKLGQQQQQIQARKIAELEQERQLLATESMLRGQEEERSRLARDLHDGLGGMLSTVKLYLGAARGQAADSAESARLFTRSLEHLDSSISEMRRVARDLMPESLLNFGLQTALQDLCDAVRQSQQLQVQSQFYGLDERLPQRTELVVYRLVQELLNNVLKHAQAQQVIVQVMRHADTLHLVVEDNGQGFDARHTTQGMGLRSVQSRVDYLNGTLDVQTTPGEGTAVSIELQLKAEKK